MNIHRISVGALQCNCYLIEEGGSAVLIDCGGDGSKIIEFAESRNLKIEAVLLTHGHVDHIQGVDHIIAQYHCPVYVHEGDFDFLYEPMYNLSERIFRHPIILNTKAIAVKDSEVISVGSFKFQVIHTPGHTPGSVCYLMDDHLFTGDTLFLNSIGNEFPPFGNFNQEIDSIKKRLFSLERDYVCHPGHGESTTLFHEKANNPYCRLQMEIKISGHSFEYDVTGMSLLFFPGESVVFTDHPSGSARLSSRLVLEDGVYVAKARFCYLGKVYTCRKNAEGEQNELLLAAVKYSIYQVFHQATGICPPWGILTGIKPTGIYRRLLNEKGIQETRRYLLEEYCMQPEKIPLLHQICMVMNEVQTDIKTEASLYVSIPFCPSRCSYCSFISIAAEKSHHLIERYLEKLENEIREKCAVLKRQHLQIKSIYIGGGTPGILNLEQMKHLLDVIRECVTDEISEFSFELGRPDTVDIEKLQLLKNYGVTRICINTQTTNDAVLASVGRRHTRKQYFDAVALTKKVDFDSINTDLIAGLPGESEESFAASLQDVLSAGVDNITIHTLSIKRSSRLYGDGTHFDPSNDHVQRMLDNAYDVLLRRGFVPYYMYRQKNTVSNGENIGFCRPDKICAYNLYMMEDLHTIAACGAGASSKIISSDTGRIERVINMKYPYEYINENGKIDRNTMLFEEKLKENL